MKAFSQIDTREDFANFVRGNRIELGMTQEELASKAGVAVSTIAKIENWDGYKYNPSVVVAVKILKALDCRLIAAPEEVSIYAKIQGRIIVPKGQKKGDFEK